MTARASSRGRRPWRCSLAAIHRPGLPGSQKHPNPVIASRKAARQSSSLKAQRLDCFAVLAMTARTSSRGRRPWRCSPGSDPQTGPARFAKTPQPRHCEQQSGTAIQQLEGSKAGLLRCARNDGAHVIARPQAVAIQSGSDQRMGLALFSEPPQPRHCEPQSGAAIKQLEGSKAGLLRCARNDGAHVIARPQAVAIQSDSDQRMGLALFTEPPRLRHCEPQSGAAIQQIEGSKAGLLRCARNDGAYVIARPQAVAIHGGSLRLQRRQSVALTRPVAGGMFDIEFAARRRSTVVNGAIHLLANLTGQRNTARCCAVGTAHADDIWRQPDGHIDGNAAFPGKAATGQFRRMKIDTKGSAAGTAALANIHFSRTRQRQSSWPEARYFFSKGVIGSSVCHGSAVTGWPVN